MKENSRTRNALLNIFFGFIAQIGIFVLSFIGRKIFLHFLSAEYLGINGLYSNILSLLSLAELGLDTAVVFSLYKPVADKNVVLIHSLLNYFKKIYYVLAIVIFIIGLGLIPCLRFIITSDLQINDLIIFYILFLFNTVISYFIAHKVALLSAFQEQRIQRIAALLTNLVLQVVHIIVLLIWKNYYFYIIANICSTILSNAILGIICNKIHKEVFNEKQIIEFDKKPIKKRIFSTFLYRVGSVLITSTDNILISILVGTITVGFYSNYLVIISAIQGLIGIITASLVVGVGNYVAQGKQKEQSELFDMMLFFFHFLAALGLIGFSLLFNNLITIWLGEEYLFDDKTVFIISFNFYFTNAISPVWIFREANGLFGEVRYVLLIRALLNIVFSIMFGIIWGTFGIFLATAISLFLTNFWIEPRLISKRIFQRPQYIYWFKQLKYIFITCISFLSCYFAIYFLGTSIIMLCLKAIIICVITGGMFLIVNLKTKEFKKFKSYIFINKKIQKIEEEK